MKPGRSGAGWWRWRAIWLAWEKTPRKEFGRRRRGKRTSLAVVPSIRSWTWQGRLPLMREIRNTQWWRVAYDELSRAREAVFRTQRKEYFEDTKMLHIIDARTLSRLHLFTSFDIHVSRQLPSCSSLTPSLLSRRAGLLSLFVCSFLPCFMTTNCVLRLLCPRVMPKLQNYNYRSQRNRINLALYLRNREQIPLTKAISSYTSRSETSWSNGFIGVKQRREATRFLSQRRLEAFWFRSGLG